MQKYFIRYAYERTLTEGLPIPEKKAFETVTEIFALDEKGAREKFWELHPLAKCIVNVQKRA